MLNIKSLPHEKYMSEALLEARIAGERGDLPIGSVIVHNGQIISRGSNKIETNNNQVAHAEINAIHKASGYLREHARECVIYTTVEPCVMCLPTIVMSNIRNIVYAVEDKYMETKPMINCTEYLRKRVHNYLGGILAHESLELVKLYDLKTAELIMYGSTRL